MSFTPFMSLTWTDHVTGRRGFLVVDRLVLGVETVKTHVGNILAKLDARDRTQAVIAAYESGFVTPSG